MVWVGRSEREGRKPGQDKPVLRIYPVEKQLTLHEEHTYDRIIFSMSILSI